MERPFIIYQHINSFFADAVTPHPEGETLIGSLKYLGPPTYTHTVEPRTNKFDMVIYVERRVFLGVSYAFIPRGWGRNVSKIFVPTYANMV